MKTIIFFAALSFHSLLFAVVQEGVDSLIGDEKGFAFSSRTVISIPSADWVDHPTEVNSIDFGISDGYLSAGVKVVSGNLEMDSNLLDLGIVNFDSILAVPTGNWVTLLNNFPNGCGNTPYSLENHVFIIRTKQNRFAKLKVNRFRSQGCFPYEFVFVWSYQDDGSTSFQKVAVTSVPTNKEYPTLGVYPNPSISKFYINSSEFLTNILNAAVYNIDGGLITHLKPNQLFNGVAWESLRSNGKKISPGTYFLNVNYKTAKKIIVLTKK